MAAMTAQPRTYCPRLICIARRYSNRYQHTSARPPGQNRLYPGKPVGDGDEVGVREAATRVDAVQESLPGVMCGHPGAVDVGDLVVAHTRSHGNAANRAPWRGSILASSGCEPGGSGCGAARCRGAPNGMSGPSTSRNSKGRFAEPGIAEGQPWAHAKAPPLDGAGAALRSRRPGRVPTAESSPGRGCGRAGWVVSWRGRRRSRSCGRAGRWWSRGCRAGSRPR